MEKRVLPAIAAVIRTKTEIAEFADEVGTPACVVTTNVVGPMPELDKRTPLQKEIV